MSASRCGSSWWRSRSDVDRAKAFYVQAGFNADHDHHVRDELRFVQLTPPGSACSIAIGTGLAKMAPARSRACSSSSTDIEAARAELAERGVEVSDVQDFPWGAVRLLQRPGRQRLGRAADHRPGVAPSRGPAGGAFAAAARER